MANSTDATGIASGLAALSICESLLLALSDLKIMGERDIGGILDDAAAAHRSAGAPGKQTALNQQVVAILDRISKGGNGVPRT